MKGDVSSAPARKYRGGGNDGLQQAPGEGRRALQWPGFRCRGTAESDWNGHCLSAAAGAATGGADLAGGGGEAIDAFIPFALPPFVPLAIDGGARVALVTAEQALARLTSPPQGTPP